MLGNDAIKIQFTLDSTDYEKILVKNNYSYENDYNKKIAKIRRDIRTGARKQVFKGNEKEFSYTLFDVTTTDWENIYSKLKTLNDIKYYPHLDIDYYYPAYCDKIIYTLNEITALAKIDFVFKSSEYKDLRVPTFIIVDNILVKNGVLLPGYYLNGDKI